MRYWIVSELFYPEEVSTGYVMTKIAEKLSEKVDVGVICGPSNYQSEVFKAKYQLSKKIIVKRAKVPRLDKNRLPLRMLGFLFLSFGIGFKILFNVRISDRVILVTNPPTLLPIVSFLKRIKRFNLIIIVHDVFPENAVAGGIIKERSFLFKSLSFIFNGSYKTANRLITVGRDMAEIFQKKIGTKVPIEVITNWADHEEVFPLQVSKFWDNYEKRSQGKIIIQFAGNIGRVQGLELFFAELAKIKNSEFYLVVIGDGAQKRQLQQFSNDKNLVNVQFIPSRARSEQNQFLNACDIGLVTLSSGMFGLGVPSKVYNILAAGKPVLYIGDSNSEISRYIIENNVGWAFSWDDSLNLTNFLSNIGDHMRQEIIKKGKNARILVERDFTKETILEKFQEEILKS